MVTKRASLAILFLALAGCSVIDRAREAQRAAEPRAAGESVAADRPRLPDDSLERLVAFAMTNRPSIVSARLAVEDARLALKALAADAPLVSSTPWTALDVSASASYAESSPGTTIGRDGWRTSGDPSAAISLELLVWDFGRYGAKAKAQAEAVLEAELTLANEGYTVFYEVSEAYLNHLEKRALLEVSLTNELEYAEHLAQAEARYEAGEANQLDVLKARLDVASARKVSVAASNLVDTTGATLMNVLGIDASRGTCAEVLVKSPLALQEVHQSFVLSKYPVSEAFDLARTNAPLMQVRRSRVRAASHSIDAAIADLYPTISASTSLSWTDPLWYWHWGFSAAQSIFSGFRKTTAIDRAVVSLKNYEAELDKGEQSLSVELETAIANRDNAVEALASAVASLRSAEENLSMVREQYSVGDVSRIELSEAIASHSKAIGDSLTAFYDGQRAEARLFALLGKYPVYAEEKVRVRN